MVRSPGSVKRLLQEIRRRRVARAGAIYVAAAFATLEGLDVLVPALGLSTGILSLAAAVAVLGFPVALVLAWVFDFGAGGFVRTVDEAHSTADAGREAWMSPAAWTMALLFLAVGIGAGWLTRGRGASTDVEADGIRSVAILPFANLSVRADDDYFSDGITEEIMTRLARSSNLRVAARTSSFAFKATSRTVAEIAEALGVEAVVEGSVRRDSDRVRISASLVDAASGFEIWNDTFERDLTGIFAIQDEVAEAIADALEAELGEEAVGAGSSPTDDLAAYDLYLLARSRWWSRSVPALLESVDLFDQAIRRDASFAPAYLGLAQAYMLLPTYALEAVDNEDMFVKARDAVQKAQQLDPDPSQVLHVRGFIALYYDWDLDAAMALLSEAARLAPYDPQVQNHLGIALRVAQRPEEALEAARLAAALDPLAVNFQYNLGLAYLKVGDTEEAERALRRAVEIDPENFVAVGNLLQFLALTGRPAEAARVVEEVMTPALRPAFGLWARALLAPDLRPGAIEAFAALEAASPMPPVVFAPYLVLMGAFDEALEAAEDGVESRSWTIVHATEETQRPIFGNERYRALVASAGFPLPTAP